MRIDQIMIKKVGGWNMASINEWRGLPEDEKRHLVDSDSVQFYSNGDLIDSAKLTQMQEEAREAERRRDASVEIVPQSLPSVQYSREVVAGPAWLISRVDHTGLSEPFWQVRGRKDKDIYDIETTEGLNTLAADMIVDSFGISQEGTELISSSAVVHFTVEFFPDNMGTRFWEVSSADLRSYVATNPFLRVVHN